MDKPEFLKGEVKEFIDAIVQIGLAGACKIHSIGGILELKSFYSQPFSPDMIEKYFNIPKYGKFYFNDKFPKHCEAGWYYRYKEVNDEKEYVFVNYFELRTDTLSHFISDCIRCGIKLEWRE